MKFRALQIILPVLAVAAGGITANVLVLSKKTNDAVYTDWDRVRTLDDFYDFMSRLKNNKNDIKEDFYNEFENASEHIKNIFNAYDKTGPDMRKIYNVEYEYFNSTEFKYINKQDLFNRFINSYAYLSDTQKITIYSDEGYSLSYAYETPDDYHNNVKISFYVPINQVGVPENFTYSFSTSYKSKFDKQSRFNIENSDKSAKEFLDPVGRDRRNIEVNFVSPYVFNVETKAGTFRFDYKKLARETVLSSFKNINNENKSDVFSEFEKFSNALDQDLVSTYNSIKDYLSSLLSISKFTETSSASSYIDKYKTILPSLLGKCEPLLNDEFIYNLCFVSPYLVERANETFTNKDGYSVAYSYTEVNNSTHKGNCSLILNVPLAPQEQARQIIVNIKTSDPTELFSCDYGAYKLIDAGEELKDYNVRFKFTGPYAFLIITNAGTFSFDIMDIEKQNIIEALKNIEPTTYAETYDWLSKYSYLMPEDLQEEFVDLKDTVKGIFERYVKPTSASVDTIISSQYAAYNKLDSSELKYFDKDHLIKYFFAYPYFNKYPNKIIYNDSNYSLSFVYATSKNADGKYVHELKLHIPMVAGEEATDKVITLEQTTSIDPNVAAYNLIDGNKNLATENISIVFVSPYVVKVTTPAGSYLFDFQSNDDRLLMETLKTANSTNYETIFKNIDAKLDSLPSDFVEEYNKLKAPLVYLFTNHVYNATVVDFEEYDRIYHILFDETYTYVNTQDYLQYFLIYPMLIGKEALTFTCLENPDYWFLYIFDISNTTTKAGYFTLSYKIPTSPEVLDPEESGITVQKTAPLNNSLFEFFDANSSYSADKFNIKFRYINPTSFKAITPAGEFTFSIQNTSGSADEYYLDRLHKITASGSFSYIDAHRDLLSEQFLEEYDYVKPILKELIPSATLTNISEDHAKSYISYYEDLFIKKTDYKLINVENFKRLFNIAPFFSSRLGETYKSKEGYTMVYTCSSNKTGVTGECLAKFNIPMEVGGEPVAISIKASQTYTYGFKYEEGAGVLFTDQYLLNKAGISVAFVAPYVFDVTTPAGTFRFDLKNNKENTILDDIRNITPETYKDVFAYIDNYSYTLTEDLKTEFSNLRNDIDEIFTNYKAQDSLSTTITETQKRVVDYIDAYGLKYFDKDQLYKYFSLYPYFCEYANEKIYSGENYVLYGYGQDYETADGVKNVDYFSVFVPLVEGGDPQELLWYLPHQSSTYAQAHKLIDAENLFERDDVSVTFENPYVVKVTTPAGSFSFDFKANDDLILMRSINKLNESNYQNTFNKIEERADFLPKEFMEEYNTLKKPLSSLLGSYSSGSLVNRETDPSFWKGIYDVLFGKTYKYFTADNYLSYLPIYSILLDKECVTFVCLENSNYTIKYCYYENFSGNSDKLEITYAIPVSKENLTPSELMVSKSGNSSDVMKDYLYNVFDKGALFSSENFNITFKYISPEKFKAITPAGEFTFSTLNTTGGFEQDCIEKLNNLTNFNYIDVFKRIEANYSRLSSKFIAEYEYIKPRLETLISNYHKEVTETNVPGLLGSQANIYKELYLDKSFELINVSNFKWLFNLCYYFYVNADKTFTSPEGYTIKYHFEPTWNGKGHTYLTFVIPMEPGGSTTTITLEQEWIRGETHSYPIEGILNLVDTSNVLKNANIKIEFLEPYVFNVTTPAGTFYFSLPA